MGPSIDPLRNDDWPERHAMQASGPAGISGFVPRRLLAILVPLLIVPGAALAFSLLQEKEYEASTSILFRDTGPVLASEEPAREAATNVRLLQLPGLEDRVEARLNRPITGDVDVVAEEESNLATIIASDADPRRAARVANVYAQEYKKLRREDFVTEIESETEAVDTALADLGRRELNGSEGRALSSRLEDLRLAALNPGGVTQLNPAKPPSQPVSPKPVQNTLIGALIGLGLGLLLAIFLERRDRRIRDPRYIEYVLGRPIIGRIPRSRALAKSGPSTATLPAAESEAFRTVRENLRRQLREQDSRSLLVTSAIPGEGKTTLVWNLARVVAAAGARVLLVEADMRHPVLSHSLGTNGAAGLSELLAGRAQLRDLVQRVDFGDRTNGNGSSAPGAVDVLLAGKPPANPAELLGSERMQAVLEVAPDSYDLVVLDTPPALVSDAMPILAHVGGVVVVGRLGLSTNDSLLELRELLDNLDAPTLGVVVNADRSATGRYGGYYRTAEE